MLKSSTFWTVCWSWRLANPHSHMSLLSLAVFFDCAGTVFAMARFLGFVPILALAAASEAHLQTTVWRLGTVAAAAASSQTSR